MRRKDFFLRGIELSVGNNDIYALGYRDWILLRRTAVRNLQVTLRLTCSVHSRTENQVAYVVNRDQVQHLARVAI